MPGWIGGCSIFDKFALVFNSGPESLASFTIKTGTCYWSYYNVLQNWFYENVIWFADENSISCCIVWFLFS